MTENKHIFQVGKTYRTRDGEEAKVLLRLEHDNFSKYPLLVLSADHSDFWTANEQGPQFLGVTSGRDLLPPEKPTTPFEVGKVYKSNNGLYYRIVEIGEFESDDYPIVADCVGSDEDGPFEMVDDFDYEQERFTFDGVFMIGSRDKEDDLIPTPVEWPPVKKPANTPFEVGKYYRDREGYYYKVLAVDDLAKGYPIKVKSVGHVNGTPITHGWVSNHTVDGIYNIEDPGTYEDLLAKPVEWPVPQQATPEPPNKEVNTPFEIGKVYRDREGFYFRVVGIGDPEEFEKPIEAESVADKMGDALSQPWPAFFRLSGIYLSSGDLSEDDLLPTPVDWPLVPEKDALEETGPIHPGCPICEQDALRDMPIVDPGPDWLEDEEESTEADTDTKPCENCVNYTIPTPFEGNVYAFFDVSVMKHTPEALQKEYNKEGYIDSRGTGPELYKIVRVLTLPNGQLMVEYHEPENPEESVWEHWNILTFQKIVFNLTQPSYG